jgi:hypothetical protein
MTVKKMIQTDQGRMQLKKMFKFVYVLYILMIEKHGGLVVEQSYINEILRRNTNN